MYNCMRISREKLEENKRKHKEELKAIIGKTVIGHNVIIDHVSAVDVDGDTITGINRITGREVTINWTDITYVERE